MEIDSEGNHWYEFPNIFLNFSENATIDLSYMNQRANQKISIKDGHFVRPDGTPIRFFGINFCYAAGFPDKSIAPYLAKRIAQLGINLVRFHHMDNYNIWENNAESKLSEQKLDRLHYFLYCLGENGIYANINLHVSRVYPEPEFTKELQNNFSYAKGLDRYYPPFIRDQLKYAHDLVGSYNNYTKHTLGDDPMILNIELNNENSMFDLTTKYPYIAGTVFETELLKQWHNWLRKNYPSSDGFSVINKTWNNEPIDRSYDLIVNATRSWQTDTNTEYSFDSETGIHTFNVKSVPVQTWSNQLHFNSVNVTAETTYTIEFEGSAIPNTSGNDISISFSLQENRSPYSTFHVSSPIIVLTSTMTKYTAKFSTQSSVETSNKILFKIIVGAVPGTYHIRNIKLYQGMEIFKFWGDTPTIDTIGIPDSSWPRLSQSDFRLFIRDTEESTQLNITNYIKNELGFKDLYILDSQCNYGTFLSYTREYEISDILDIHSYWQHPSFEEGHSWENQYSSITNLPMFNSTSYGTMNSLTQFRPYNKPYTLSEYNHPFPNEHLHEKFPILGAMASFYDWDAIYQFAYDHSGYVNNGYSGGYFDMKDNPIDFALAPFCAFAFRQKYVSKSNQVLYTKVPKSKVESANKNMKSIYTDLFKDKPIPKGYPSRFEIEIADTNSGEIEYNFVGGEINASNEGSFETDEIIWKNTKFYPNETASFRVNTTKYKTVTGFIGNNRMTETVDLDLLKLNLKLNENLNESATVGIVTLDDNELQSSSKILLVIAGKFKNSNQKWNTARTSIGSFYGGNWGNAPLMVQYIKFNGTLFFGEKEKPTIWTINYMGEKNQTLNVQGKSGEWTFQSDEDNPSLQYLIERVFPEGNLAVSIALSVAVPVIALSAIVFAVIMRARKSTDEVNNA
ncbi:cellulase family glycosylhydrolase [Histomonas meleagridis]|uniref:cellulase family glycosylhydrolase n=1 Tax=Histomonas meleagridis TaxID=135588 RepID=UPI00355A6C4D|nr:cellulase family glycosylhydrolase [Histomonas meleagridis]KAH0800563.1 cellulase family glycosylhydrolase [Histomonas meleagridis]